MTSQPADTGSNISPAAATLLAVGVLAGTTLAGLVVAQAIVPTLHVYLGVGPLLGTISGMCGCGFIIHTAAAQVMRRLDHVEARMEEQREAGYAEGYVAASGARHLTAVSQR